MTLKYLRKVRIVRRRVIKEISEEICLKQE